MLKIKATIITSKRLRHVYTFIQCKAHWKNGQNKLD